MMTEVYSARFPHSEIAGSKDICSSPTLIAAYHVFRRLSVPRHPPCALCSMTTSMYSVTLMGRSCLWLKMCFINKKFDYLRFDVLSFSICSFQGTCMSSLTFYSSFLKHFVALENLRFSRSRAFCKYSLRPVPSVSSKLDSCSSPSSVLSKSFRGDNEIRTRDLLLARQALSQLSYTPMILASTYSPVPSPAKYHRPLRS